VAKRLHEIKQFNVGTALTPSDTDIPEEAATYSENIDPMAQDGILKGINSDIIKYYRDSGDIGNSTASSTYANGASSVVLADSTVFAGSGSIIFTDSEGYVQVLSYSGNNTGTETLTGVSGWHSEFGDLESGTKVYKYGSASNFISNNSALINNNGTRHLVYFDNSDNRFSKIDNYYGEDTNAAPLLNRISDTQFDHTDTPVMVKNNKEVHVGMGNGLENKPLWCGFHSQGQFGEAASTLLDVEDAELHSPTTFPSFYKTVVYGDYIYGIEYDGTYLYYIDKSDSNYPIYVSNLTFLKTKTLALDHNNNLMIVNNDANILWLDISSSTHSILRNYAITQGGSEVGYSIGDIMETGASSTYYIWLAKHIDGVSHGGSSSSTINSPQGTTGTNVGPGMLQNVVAPTGTSGTLTFTDRTPFMGLDEDRLSHNTGSSGGGIDLKVGWWCRGSSSSAAPADSLLTWVRITTYPRATLVKSNETDWVGWICEYLNGPNANPTHTIGLVTTNDSLTGIGGGGGEVVETGDVVSMNGPVLNWVKNSYAPVYDKDTTNNNDPDPTEWFPVRLRTSSTSTDIIGKWGADGDLIDASLNTTWDNITSIYSHNSPSVSDDRIFMAINTTNSSGITDHNTKIVTLKYNDVTPSGGTLSNNHWYATDDTGSWLHNSTDTVFSIAFGTDAIPQGDYTTDQDKIQSAIMSSDDTGFAYDLWLNSGNGNGKLALINSDSSGSLSHWTKKQTAPLDISLSQANMITNTSFAASKEFWYKASFLYDGYQEGPLSSAVRLGTTEEKNVNVTMSLYRGTLSSRVTHVNLYRAEGSRIMAGGTILTEPTGYYRLIDSYELDISWGLSTDTTWGNTRTRDVIDTYKLGASYEGRTGISEVLDHSIPNYSLSTDLNSHLFVAKCHHQLIKDANNYIFKSKPYKYDQFNWINDFLILPTTPTALKSFNGRLWAFDESNSYKIEPNNLYIEDTIDGVGCLSQRSIIVTDYGMCFCDKHNIYLHNGQMATPISVVITGDGDSNYEWGKLDSSWAPFVTWSNKYKSFIILFKAKDGAYRIWAYNVIKQRWDLWKPFFTYGGSYLTQEPTDVFIGKNGEINVCINNLIYVLFQDPRKKAWTWHSKKLTLGQDTQIKRFNNFNVTGSPSGSLGNASTGIAVKIDGTLGTEAGSLASFTVAADEQSGKHLQWILSGQTSTVDALGTIYRRKIVTSEQ